MEPNDKQAFHQSTDYLSRINDLLQVANYNSMEQNYQEWFLTLKSLYRELFPLLIDGTKKQYEESINTPEIIKCENFINELTGLDFEYSKILAVVSRTGLSRPSTINHRFAEKLGSFDKYLKFCINLKGLLIASAGKDNKKEFDFSNKGDSF